MSRALGRSWIGWRVAAIVAAGVVTILLPAGVAAHPLGNFTINHYAGLRVAPDRVELDVVIDQAEIPTFQERQRIDTNADGQLSDAELEAEREVACGRLATFLDLTVAGRAQPLTLTAVGLSFLSGAGGLPIMRLVCEYETLLPATITAKTEVSFVDHSTPERIGWREIVVQGDGLTVSGSLLTASISNRLTTYPPNSLSQALDVRSANFSVEPGGAELAAWAAPDASPPGEASATGASPAGGPSAVAPTGSAPGGVAAEISGLLGTKDVTPLVLLLSMVTAAALGAGHALTPGHGKTIMAAYLVGTRGTLRHALGLGLATAVSHTIGVLALALLIVAAGSAFSADRVYPILTTASGLIVVAIGAWLLAAQVTRRLRVPTRPSFAAAFVPVTVGGTAANARGHDGSHSHDHPDGPEHSHDDQGPEDRHPHEAPPAAASHHGQAYAEAQPTHVASDAGLHRHGWRAHSHVPATTSGDAPTLTWKSLFALGLSGGLVPSTNALLILVATVAAGRAVYGLVLVVAFGIGMAAVLVGVGIAMVYASGLIGRVPRSTSLNWLVGLAPTGAALAVLALGLYLTQQALAGTPVL